MRARVTAPAALGAVLVAIAGCSSGGGVTRASSSQRSTPTPAAAAASVRCGEAGVIGRQVALVRSRMLSLPGAPDGIATTPDGDASFVAIQSGVPRIAVIANAHSGERLLRSVVVPAYASGIKLTPDGRYVLAAAGRGVVVLDASAAISGVGRALLGSLAAPASVAGAGPGAAEVAVSPDSRYAFVTLEAAGVVAVFNLADALARGLRPSAFVGSVPVGAGALGITVSPDGRWIYEVSESAMHRSGIHEGALNVIDLERAESQPMTSLVGSVPAPCAPVRVAVSPDGKIVWVTAKDANALLGFSAAQLRADPARALVSVTHVGLQPLGLAVADRGAIVLVADADLSHAQRTDSTISVVDARTSGQPALLGVFPAGKLADAISVLPAGNRALVTNSDSRQLEALVVRPVSALVLGRP